MCNPMDCPKRSQKKLIILYFQRQKVNVENGTIHIFLKVLKTLVNMLKNLNSNFLAETSKYGMHFPRLFQHFFSYE